MTLRAITADLLRKRPGKRTARTDHAGHADYAGCTVCGTLGDFLNRGYGKHTTQWRVVNIFAKHLLQVGINPATHINITSPSTVRMAAKTSMTCSGESTQGSTVTATWRRPVVSRSS